MEVKKAKAKKFSPAFKNFRLPSKTEKHVGIFNGENVTVSDLNSMNILYERGNFGKGTLSKAAPKYHTFQDDIPRVITEEQFENAVKWNSEIHYSCPEKYIGFSKHNMELSVNSVNSFLQSAIQGDNQESWSSWKKKHKEKSESVKAKDNISTNNLLEFTTDEDHIDLDFCKLVNDIHKSKKGRKPVKLKEKTEEEVIVVNEENSEARLERLTYVAEENLNLGLEESFFLNFAIGCLTIVDLQKKELSSLELWEKFNAAQSDFLERYVVYHYYRTKGWVVKSGLKFGGDFLLYKNGPAYYHASYLIQVINKKKAFTWREFSGINRLVETFNKNLILCEVSSIKAMPEEISFPECLKNYRVNEILSRRWIPSKERISQDGVS